MSGGDDGAIAAEPAGRSIAGNSGAWREVQLVEFSAIIGVDRRTKNLCASNQRSPSFFRGRAGAASHDPQQTGHGAWRSGVTQAPKTNQPHARRCSTRRGATSPVRQRANVLQDHLFDRNSGYARRMPNPLLATILRANILSLARILIYIEIYHGAFVRAVQATDRLLHRQVGHGERRLHYMVARRWISSCVTCVLNVMRTRDWIAFTLYTAGIMVTTMMIGIFR